MPLKETCYYTGAYLSFQGAAPQVLSAQVSLTAVFGMGTGGTSPLSTPILKMVTRTRIELVLLA